MPRDLRAFAEFAFVGVDDGAVLVGDLLRLGTLACQLEEVLVDAALFERGETGLVVEIERAGGICEV